MFSFALVARSGQGNGGRIFWKRRVLLLDPVLVGVGGSGVVVDSRGRHRVGDAVEVVTDDPVADLGEADAHRVELLLGNVEEVLHELDTPIGYGLSLDLVL